LLLKEPAIVKFLDDVPADIHFDGNPTRLNAFNFAYLSTITSNGLNLKVTPSACSTPNRFEAVVTHVTVGELLSAFWRMSFGATLNTTKLEREMVASVRFDAPDPIAWFMDGDRFEPTRTIVVRLGPRLRFLQ
jgi:diacylglycerol kinase family enzyme